MTTAVSKFLNELRRDPRFAEQPEFLKSIAEMFETIESEGDEIPDAKVFFSGVEWILNQPDPIETRLMALARLSHVAKAENLNMRQFYRPQ
jgi:hypothetical protein